MRTLVLEPLMPLSVWAGLVGLAGAAGLVYLLYRPPEISVARRIAVVLLWWLGTAGPLVLLLNPSWVQNRPADSTKPRLLVLLDTSGSMATEDENGKPRLEAASGELEAAHGSLQSDFDVELTAFDGSFRSEPMSNLSKLTASGEVTDVAGALEEALQAVGQRAGAVLVLSDGADNVSEGPEEALKAAGVAKALGLPIFARTYGGASSLKDIAVEISSPRELAFVGQEMTINARIDQRGFDGAVAEVTLADDERIIERREVALGARTHSPVTFNVKQDSPGVYMYQLEVTSAPEEVTRLNNRAVLQLIVVDEAVKVLVLEGKPYWDFRFLLKALARDEAVEATGVVRLTPTRLLVRELASRERDPEPPEPSEKPAAGQIPDEKVSIVDDAAGFLSDMETLNHYQIVILGRDAETFLTETALANLKEWIGRRGGTLLCARGKPVQVVSQRLDPLMPVRWAPVGEERLRVRLTPFGQSLRWFPPCPGGVEGSLADKMPSLAASHAASRTKPLASVVATADSNASLAESPVITYQPYGAGRTVVLEGAGMWRWALLAPKYEDYNDIYRFFWSSLVRWILSSNDFLPSQTVALRPVQSTFTTREKVMIFVMLKSEEEEFSAAHPPVVEVVSGTGAEPLVVTAAPSGREVGLFRVVAGPLEAGFYQARLKRSAEGPPAECVFQVQPALQEQLDVAARPDFLARIARDSGGMAVGEGDLDRIRGAYAEYWMKTHPAQIRRTTAWDKLWVMMLAVSVWSAAWIVRRRGGLI